MIPLTVGMLFVFLIPRAAVAQQSSGELFKPHFEGSVGIGYIHAAGGITDIWTDGGEAEFSVVYRFFSFLGLEATGIAGFTGITDSMKNTVTVVDSYGYTSTESDTGGLYLNILLGPLFSFRIGTSPGNAIVLTLGGGGFRYGEMEAGIGASNYQDRWSFGWGGYASVGVQFQSPNSNYWGLQLRYLYSPSNVNDFYWWSASHYTDDQRIMLSVDMGGS
jgi:hypothetical protein